MHIVEQPHPYWKGNVGFTKVLCPTDFSPAANYAIENALCLPGVREVIVHHVVRTYFEKHSHWSTLFDIHENQKFIDMYVEAEMAKVPSLAQKEIQCRSLISEGKPASQIVETAAREGVDAIVMGPSGGAVTGLVIRASDRPVLAVPQVERPVRPLQNLSRVVVTTDFSPYSRAVVDYAFRLRQLVDFEMFLLYVVEFSNAIRFGIRKGHYTGAVGQMKAWAKRELENMIPDQLKDGNAVRCFVDEGTVAEKIAGCADAYDANLVIMGAHGYGAVERFFLGTTTDKVLHLVSRPMLVVKM